MTVAVEIHRQPLWVGTDWQLAIRDLCRRERQFGPPVLDWLRETGLMSNCLLLASDTRAGPLIFRYIGQPSIKFLGRRWAAERLGTPESENPFHELGDGVGEHYHTAIDGGEILLNRIRLVGMSAEPLTYTHLLVGWRASDGRRALLSCLDARV